MSSGHLYVIEDPDRGFVKIGKTVNPQTRPQALAQHMGITNPQIFIVGPFEDCFSAESFAHRQFKHWRQSNSEWFRMPFAKTCAYLSRLHKREVKEDGNANKDAVCTDGESLSDVCGESKKVTEVLD